MTDQTTAEEALLDFSNLAHELSDGEMSHRELTALAHQLLNKHGETLRSAAIAVKENQQ